MAEITINKVLSCESLVPLLLDSQIPESWEPSSDKITYGTLKNLFMVVDDHSLSSSVIVNALNLLSGLDLSENIKKPSGFVAKISNYIKKNPMCTNDVVKELVVVTHDTLSLGVYCEKINVTKNSLKNINNFDNPDFPVLVNGAVLEIEKYRAVSGASWSTFSFWILTLMGKINEYSEVPYKQIKFKVESIKSEKALLLKKTYKVDHKNSVESLLSSEFILPAGAATAKKAPITERVLLKNELNSLQLQISELLQVNSDLESQLNLTCEALREESELRHIGAAKFSELAKTFENLKKEKNKINSDLNEKIEKLSSCSTRNLNKKIKRQKEKAMNLKNDLKDQTDKTIMLEQENQTLNDQLTKALESGLKSRKKNYYLNNKHSPQVKDETRCYSQSYVSDLKSQILILENEKLELEEKIKSFVNNEIKVYKNGCYNDDICMVYEDLLCMGLSTRNVEKVICVVLEKLAGLQVEKLPKPTFAKYMLLEARGLAQIHVASELMGDKFLVENNNNYDADFSLNSDLNNDLASITSSASNSFDKTIELNNNTLHSDGTSKKGHSYITYDINKPDGKTLVTGLREVGSGDASTQLETLKEILADISEYTNDNENKFVNNAISSIKNTMSDRCATQKKFNSLFCQFRKSVLPTVTDNWSSLNPEQQKSMSTVNDFFCGLHFLVGLADQAEACLKVYEKLLIGENKVGALAHGGYSNGESGTTRLIRTVCKSVQERGCEKSGRMVTFATQMKEEHGVSEIPLYPFLGNRFNILFLNGAGVFYLHEKLLNFFTNVEKENKLLTAVFWDLQVLPYRIGCRALGLIHKLVTAPLWRKMEIEKNVLNMTPHYQKMLDLFEKWANDCSSFLTGADCLFPELVHKDDLYYTLIKPDADIDEMTKQCLEMIFSSFVLVSKRMLHDHLVSGRLNNPSETLIHEAKSVPTTNAEAERDFGMLDRLMKLKPKALDMVYEGMIMFNRNKTKEWRNSLTKEKLAFVMKKARGSKLLQKKHFFERKTLIHQQRVSKFKNAAEERERKAKELAAEKERLVHQIEELGGLWDAKNVNSMLKKHTSDREKRFALKIQLNFRQKVLGVKCDRSLFFMSSGGKNKSLTELTSNLFSVINYSSPSLIQEVDQEYTPIFSVLPSHILASEKERFLREAHACENKEKKSLVNEPKPVFSQKRKKKKNCFLESEKQLPVISSPDDFIGKLIEHFTDRNIEGEESDWFKGIVVQVAGGSKMNPKYFIRYFDIPNELFCSNLYDDYKNGEVNLLPVCPEDFIDATILHLYTDEGSGDDTWWSAEVVDIDIESSDMKNPDFFVLYEDTESSEAEPEYFLSPLIHDYLNGWVRFVDYPASNV